MRRWIFFPVLASAGFVLPAARMKDMAFAAPTRPPETPDEKAPGERPLPPG
jgi:hypothetical protein